MNATVGLIIIGTAFLFGIDKHITENVNQYTIISSVNLSATVDRIQEAHQRIVLQQEKEKQDKRETLVATIVNKYKVDKKLAESVVNFAEKHQRDDFPKVEDIIAIVGIESSFRPHVKSALKRDPAVGLMQVRPGVWKIPMKELSTIDGQIQHGVKILEQYYKRVGKVDGAVMAYNIGITAYRKGKKNERYLKKYKNEVAMYK